MRNKNAFAAIVAIAGISILASVLVVLMLTGDGNGAEEYEILGVKVYREELPNGWIVRPVSYHRFVYIPDPDKEWK